MTIAPATNDGGYRLSPAQGLQILAISELLRSGELTLSGDDAEKAQEALTDAAQEIALQIGTN